MVENKTDAPNERLTRKQKKGGIADYFLKDDESIFFSKNKYETLNDKWRRMGNKKK